MLGNQQYTVCVRQEVGYCMIDYTPTATTSPSAFQVGAAPTSFSGVGGAATTSTPGAIALASPAQWGCSSADAYLVFPSDLANVGVYCGYYLNPRGLEQVNGVVRDQVAPFTFNVLSTIASANIAGVGFSLVYSQVPCI